MGKRGRRRTRQQQQDEEFFDTDVNDPRKCSVAIIGSGLTGLATALILACMDSKRSIDLYERDQSFDARKEGYGLTLTYNPVGILHQLGILNEIADADCPSRSHYIFRQCNDGGEGEIIGYYGNDFVDKTDARSTGYGQRGNLRVPRQKVRQILLQRLQQTAPQVTIHWNHKLVNVDLSDQGVALYFENGSFGKAGLVIAADGIHSTAVKCCLGPNIPEPQSLGVHVILGITGPEEKEEENCDKSLYGNTMEKVPEHNKLSNDGQHDEINPDCDVNRMPENSTTSNRYDKTFRPDLQFPDLFQERGFYTLSNNRRLFVMPFSKANISSPNAQPRYMWQLSFDATLFATDCGDLDRDTSNKNIANDRNAYHLQQVALHLTNGWHEPVHEMIRSTPLQTIWGTLLLDRDPLTIQKALSLQQHQRMVVAGDALHAMSPFKGQGANNCLRDAQTIAKWFGPNVDIHSKERTSTFSASIKGCMRELVQRTAPIVQASRQAARYWHSTLALEEEHKYAGIDRPDFVLLLRQELKKRSINAATPNLTNSVRAVIHELLSTKEKNQYPQDHFENTMRITTKISNAKHYVKKKHQAAVDSFNEDIEALLEQAYQAAYTGDLGVLRKISWYYPNLLRNHSSTFVTTNEKESNKSLLSNTVFAENEDIANTPTAIATTATIATAINKKKILTTTCLHAAAEGGQAHVVHWLVTEAGCSILATNANGQTPDQVALDMATQDLLNRLRKTNSPI